MEIVRFESLASGGDAIGRDLNGRVTFAARAAPGDLASVVIEQQSRTFARGQLLQILEPSPHRAAPPCPFFRDDLTTSCGGCAWQHVSYVAQLEAKRGIVRDALRRIGGVADADALVAPCVPSPRNFAYRNKADFVASQDENSHMQFGFFAPESHRVIGVSHCLIQTDTNNAILTAVLAALQLGLVEPFDPASGRGVLRRVVARTASTGESLACAVTTRAAWPQEHAFAAHLRRSVPSLVGVLRREAKSEARLIRSEGARDWLEEAVGGVRLRVTGEGFFQVNPLLVETLVATVLDFADVRNGENILDLFCGVGLFSLALAQRGGRVLGIERSALAVRDAVGNAARNTLEARFIAGDAAGEMRRLAARNEKFDCIVLDPPRAGAVECLPAILQLNPHRVVYVSCDPATLARDVKTLQSAYRLRAAVPLDLFPQTAHVETVAILEK